MTTLQAVSSALVSVILMGVGSMILIIGVMLFHHVMTWRP